MNETGLVAIYDLIEVGFEEWQFPVVGLVGIAIGVTLVVIKYVFHAIDARTGYWFSRHFKRKIRSADLVAGIVDPVCPRKLCRGLVGICGYLDSAGFRPNLLNL